MGELLLAFGVVAFCVFVGVAILIQAIIEKVEDAAWERNYEKNREKARQEMSPEDYAMERAVRKLRQFSQSSQGWERWSQQEEETDQEAEVIPGLSPEATRLAQYAASTGQIDEFLDDPGDFIESLW